MEKVPRHEPRMKGCFCPIDTEAHIYRRCRMAREYEIVYGPGNMDLMFSQYRPKHALSPDVSFDVLFGKGNTFSRKMKVLIDGAVRVNNSDEEWSIVGWRKAYDGTLVPVKGKYNSHTRKGKLEDVEKTDS